MRLNMDNISLFSDMEAIYIFGVSVNWDVEQMRKYGRLYGYNFEIINKLALSYVEHKGNQEEYKKLVDLFKHQKDEEINKIYNFCVSINWDIHKMIEYGRLHAYSLEEIKELALSYILPKYNYDEYWKLDNLFRKYDIKEIDSRYNVNPVLLRKGVRTQLLWRTDDEKEEVLKYIYDAWKNTNLSKANIIDMFHIDNHKLNKLLFMYARDYLSMSFEEWQNEDKKIMASKHLDYSRGKASVVLDKLLKLKNVDEIVDTIDSSGLSSYYLRQAIHNHLVTHVHGDYDKNQEILTNALDQYLEYKAKERKEKRASDKERQWQKYVEDTLPAANKLVEDFINSNYDNVQNYVDANYVNFEGELTGVQIFNKCLELVKEHNEELYKKYREKIDGKRNKIYAVVVEKIKKIINLLKDGVIDNDIKRPFDLIDYYQTTKLSFDDTLKIAKSLLQQSIIQSKDYALLVRFVKTNQSGEKVVYSDIKRILTEKQEINCEKNSKGYPIPGTGEVVSEEIKNKLIEYLKQYGVPVNYRTYHIAFNRYKNGLIDLNDSKQY